MSDLFWLSDEQMARLKPFFPKSHGRPRVDDRRVLSGIIFINRNGLRWRDAPAEYGPALEKARHRLRELGDAEVGDQQIKERAITEEQQKKDKVGAIIHNNFRKKF